MQPFSDSICVLCEKKGWGKQKEMRRKGKGEEQRREGRCTGRWCGKRERGCILSSKANTLSVLTMPFHFLHSDAWHLGLADWPCRDCPVPRDRKQLTCWRPCLNYPWARHQAALAPETRKTFNSSNPAPAWLAHSLLRNHSILPSLPLPPDPRRCFPGGLLSGPWVTIFSMAAVCWTVGLSVSE